jgi:hypothetical protein
MNFTLTGPAKQAILNGEAPWLKDGEMSFNRITIRKGTSPGTLDVIFCRDGVELTYNWVLMPKFEEGETLNLMGINFTQKLEII